MENTIAVVKGESIRLLSTKDLASLKRKLDGANTRIERLEAEINALVKKLQKKNVTLSERRSIRTQILRREEQLVNAKIDRKHYDTEYRAAALLVNNQTKEALAGLRFEGRVLPVFKEKFLPEIQALLKQSVDDNKPKMVEAFLELNRLACSAEYAAFNRLFWNVLKEIDGKLFKNIDRTKSLKVRLLHAMYSYFETLPDYLPQNSFEESEAMKHYDAVEMEQ